MIKTEPARAATGRLRVRRLPLAGLLVASVASGVVLGKKSPESPSSTPVGPAHILRPERHPALGEAAGAVPDGTTIYDDEVPGVAKLEPALRDALRRAASAAASDGVEFLVDSGWRSRAYQEQLLREAIAKYGSEAQAAHWVATPTTSAHVSGHAVDMASGAAAWLSAHGAAYGLCQVYRNEPWHYELRPAAIADGCPPTYADPAQDPRMRR